MRTSARASVWSSTGGGRGSGNFSSASEVAPSATVSSSTSSASVSQMAAGASSSQLISSSHAAGKAATVQAPSSSNCKGSSGFSGSAGTETIASSGSGVGVFETSTASRRRRPAREDGGRSSADSRTGNGFIAGAGGTLGDTEYSAGSSATEGQRSFARSSPSRLSTRSARSRNRVMSRNSASVCCTVFVICFSMAPKLFIVCFSH
mmetsp:Transcript_26471/g.56197  ORF Transcript_26471/g.56197 Transcript_26471/m.56197 type:complete len:206 (+) Transcript_26471:258-875(+)